MKLLKFKFLFESQTSFSADLLPGYNELDLPAGIKAQGFFNAVASTLFSEKSDKDASLLTGEVEFEIHQKKISTSQVQGVNLDAALASTILKNKDILSYLLTCDLGVLEDHPRQQKNVPDHSKRLAELRQDLDSYYKIEELSQKLDEVQSEIFETQEKLRKFKGPLQSKRKLELEYEQYKALDKVNFTDQIIDALKKFDRSQDRYQEEIYELGQDVERQSFEIEIYPNKPWFLQNEALIGAAISLVGFICSGFARGNVWMFYVALLISVLPLGMLVFAVIKSNKQEETLKTLKNTLKETEQKRVAAQKRMEAESVPVHRLFDVVGIKDCSEILDMLSKREEILAELSLVDSEIEKLSSGSSSESLMEKLQGLERKSAEIEKELSSFPPLVSDYHSMQIEIENLEKMMGVDPSSLIRTSKDSKSGLVSRLISLASLAVFVPEDKLIPVLLKGVEKNMSSITNGSAVTMLKTDSHWEFQSAYKFLPLEEFSEIQQRAILFSIQFTLWQMISHRFPIFFIVDATSIQHGGLKQLIVNAAKHISQRAQVIVVR